MLAKDQPESTHALLWGTAMSESRQDQHFTDSNDVPVESDAEIEARIDVEIATLWTSHQAGKATTKRTKLEMEAIRHDLGDRLWEMKSLLVCAGRLGGWSAYLRSHQLPRATADRYINQLQASMVTAANCLTEAVCEPTIEDVHRLVHKLMPRLRRTLMTQELLSEFLHQVVQQLSPRSLQNS